MTPSTEAALLQQVIDLLKEQNKQREKRNQLNDDNYKTGLKTQELSNLELKQLKLVGSERTKYFREQEQALLNIEEKLLGQAAALNDATQITQDQKDLVGELFDLRGAELDTLLASADLEEQVKKKLGERKELLEETKDLSLENDQIMQSIAEKIGVGNSKLTKTVNKAAEFAVQLTTAEGATAAFLSAFETFNPAQILGSLIENTISLAVEVDKLTSEMVKASGAGSEMQEAFANLSRESLNNKIALDQFANGVNAVRGNLIGLAGASASAQANIALQVAEFTKLGVEGETVTNIMNNMNKSMGVTAQDSLAMTEELIGAGAQLGIGPKQMADGFLKASGTLAVHGKKSVDVFKNLSAAAREAGTSVDSLVAIAGKFDTFSDAADSAGKLNAILGTTMSATDMLLMKEDERVETLIKTVNSTGRAFGQMDRFTQKAIAQAAGISDMAEANRIFGMSLGDYKKHQAQMQQSEENQKAFNDAMNQALPIMTQITLAFQSMALDGGMVNNVLKIMEFGMGLIEYFALALQNPLSTIGLVLGAIAIKGFAMATGSSLAAVALAKLGVISSTAAPQITIFGAGASAAVGPILAIGAAALMAGIGIGAAAYGVSYLAASFKELEGEQLLAAVAGILAFGTGLYFLVPALAAVTTTGIAAMGVLLGLSLFAYSIGTAAKNIGTAYEKIFESSEGMFGAVSNLNDIANSITDIGTALALIPDKKLFSATLENIALITTGKSASMSSSSAMASNLMSNITNNLKNNINLVIEIDGEKLESKITKIISDYNGDSTATVR